jgi:putative CocE/NonD family hydrolase
VTLISRAFAAVAKLPAPLARRVTVHRGRSVRTRDGVILRTDVYRAADDPAPVLLIRTPYGRGGPHALVARAVAERGFHVVVQSCRGTADSGGVFEPMRHEQDDGLDCVDWLRLQPWYGGAFAMFGPSYVGFTQWAVAADAGTDLKALCTMVTAASFRDATYAGGGFSLDTVLTWSSLVAAQRGPATRMIADLLRGQPALKRGLRHAVLAEADLVAVGAEVPHFQAWLRETAADAPYWLDRGHAHRVAEVTAPVLMIGGWYDIFLPWQLVDYATLRAAGRRPRLVVGPWHHGSATLLVNALREAVPFLVEHLRGGRPNEDPPVRVFVGGARAWRAFEDWPPAHRVQEWFLNSDDGLATQTARDPGRRRFRYDPSDPTPSVGGPRLMGRVAGIRDNRRVEARPDVLVYTSAPLEEPVEAIGPVRAVIRTTSSTPSFDVFVRVCDVHPDGRSVNICDGLARVDGTPGEVHEVAVDLWPMAHVFTPGHRIRVQVSGGAHPRWARNPGTGAALAEPGPLVPSDREVLDGSRLLLPLPDVQP